MENEIKEIDRIIINVKRKLQFSPERRFVELFNKDEINKLLDYITNLQEENQKNKEYSEFYKDMTDKWKDMSNVFKESSEDYKQRIDKAIKKIEKDAELIDLEDGYNTCMAVIDILRGDE